MKNESFFSFRLANIETSFGTCVTHFTFIHNLNILHWNFEYLTLELVTANTCFYSIIQTKGTMNTNETKKYGMSRKYPGDFLDVSTLSISFWYCATLETSHPLFKCSSEIFCALLKFRWTLISRNSDNNPKRRGICFKSRARLETIIREALVYQAFGFVFR